MQHYYTITGQMGRCGNQVAERFPDLFLTDKDGGSEPLQVEQSGCFDLDAWQRLQVQALAASSAACAASLAPSGSMVTPFLLGHRMR